MDANGRGMKEGEKQPDLAKDAKSAKGLPLGGGAMPNALQGT
jgi:hypothetical protein